MNGFPAIRFNKIVSFYDVMISIYEPTLRNVRRRYENISNDFSLVLQFLSDMKMLNMVEDEIELQCLNQFQNNNIDFIKSQILSGLSNPANPLNEYINDYFGHFKLMDERYIHRPSIEERLRFSNVRNLLMELDVVKISENGSYYSIHPSYNGLVLDDVASNCDMSPDELNTLQSNQERIGSMAELFIMDYEKRRLGHYPELVRRIDHVALNDVSAGYDIQSFELPNFKSNEKRRYIEVKAVSPLNYHFYMSRGEMERASQIGEEYYLYLLPVVRGDNFDIHNLKIINQPMSILMNNEERWHVEIENLSFQMI